MAESLVYRRTFVGREAELRQLEAAFEEAAAGRPALVVVAGEPGAGKTALCAQLAASAAKRGGRTLVGHCYDEGALTLPYLPFVEALRGYAVACTPEALREELAGGAVWLARIVPEIRERIALETHLTS